MEIFAWVLLFFRCKGEKYRLDKRERGIKNLWRNIGLLLGEGERGKRERESRWCLGLEVDMSLTRVPQRCMYLHYCHCYSFFNFRDSNSIFWELSYGNWVRKLIQTKQLAVGPTNFRNWVMKTKYWMMKTLKPNNPLKFWLHWYIQESRPFNGS